MCGSYHNQVRPTVPVEVSSFNIRDQLGRKDLRRRLPIDRRKLDRRQWILQHDYGGSSIVPEDDIKTSIIIEVGKSHGCLSPIVQVWEIFVFIHCSFTRVSEPSSGLGSAMNPSNHDVRDAVLVKVARGDNTGSGR